ncbi:MAG TPA: ABC transporter permease subunit [Candidatus Krumholzibacteria bacterium]|nr:ABC transporter permease subunit [Candidatus Krumholzibacteria bacterium]
MRPERRFGATGSLGASVGVLVLGLAAAWASGRVLDLRAGDLAPGAGGWQLAGDFFGRALRPALAFEGAYDGGRLGVVLQAGRAAVTTVAFAAAAVSLSLVGGLVMGFLGSSAWWPGRRAAAVTVPVRLLAAAMRSVHELIWAVLLLAAFGTDRLVAVLAIAIPYAGTLAKVFAEMIDEAPRDAAGALAAAGASPLQGFAVGLLPRAVPDMTAYAFYRFECALRSAAVLGFFGFPTLGYYLSASFENLHYGEVWTYLYALFVLVLAVDAWSGRLRREVTR